MTFFIFFRHKEKLLRSVSFGVFLSVSSENKSLSSSLILSLHDLQSIKSFWKSYNKLFAFFSDEFSW
jgi:hypothetical protein